MSRGLLTRGDRSGVSTAGLAMAARSMAGSYQDAWLSGDDVRSVHRGGKRADGLDAVWTYASVTAIAEAIGRTPRLLVDAENNIIERGELCSLLSRPNDRQDARNFYEQLAIQLLTSSAGAVAIIKDFGGVTGQSILPAALPKELLVADASRLRPVWAPGRLRRRIGGWWYTRTDGGGMVPLETEEVLFVTQPAPGEEDPSRGVSPRTPSHRPREIERGMSRYAADFFENDAMPGTILQSEQVMTRGQRNEMKREWDEYHRAQSHRTAVLPRGLQVKDPPTMRELTFGDLGRMNREAATAVYRVPPIVMGLIENANRSNSDAQKEVFLTGVVMSLADRIATAINFHVVSAHAWPDRASEQARSVAMSRSRMQAINRGELFAHQRKRRTSFEALQRLGMADHKISRGEGAPREDLAFFFNFDADAVLMRAKLEGLTSALALHDKGVPLNHILDMLDLPIPHDPIGDVPLLGFTLVPAEQIINQPTIKPGDEDIDDEEDEEDEDVEEEEDDEEKSAKRKRRRVSKAAIERADRAAHDRFRATWAPLANKALSLQQTRIRKQGKGVLQRLAEEVKPEELNDRSSSTRASITEERLLRILFDLREAQDEVVKRLRPIQERTFRLGAVQGLTEGGVVAAEAAAFSEIMLHDPLLAQVLDQSRAAFRLIEQKRHGQVMKIIREAFDDPDVGFVDLQKSLRQFYDGNVASAQRAAFTETVKVLNGARHEGMSEAGVTRKSWHNTPGNVRPTHRAAQDRYAANPIAIDEPYDVGGHKLMYPADPNGPPQEIINCHCFEKAILEDDERDAGDGLTPGDRATLRYAQPGFFVSLTRLNQLDAQRKEAA